MRRTKHILLAIGLGYFIAAPAAVGQGTTTTSTSPAATVQQPKSEVKLPTLPANALTPADKNFGGTSIYLIDKKMRENKKKPLVVQPTKLKPQVKTAPTQKPNQGVIIKSGEDAANTKLAPQSFVHDEGDHLTPAIYRTNIDSEVKFRQVALQASASTTQYIIQVEAKRSDFYAFTRDGQSIQNDLLGPGAPILVGSKASIVSLGDGLLALHTGDVIVDAGNMPVRVMNREAGIKIPAQSCALLSYFPGSLMRITCLASAGDAVKVRTAANQDREYSLMPGQSLILDRHGVNQKTDTLSAVAQSNPLLQKSGAAMGQYGRLRSHLSAIPVVASHSRSGAPIRALGADGSEFLVDEQGDFVLNAGWLFVEAPADSVLTSDMGTVHVRKNAFINLEKIPGYFRVASCSGPNAVVADFKKYRVPLDRGEEVLFADHAPQAAELAAGDGILRRKLRQANLGGGYHAVLGDFSIYSLLYNADQLKPLRRALTLHDKHSVNRLVRTLSAIQFATGGRGDYTDAPVVGAAESDDVPVNSNRWLISNDEKPTP